MRRNIRWAQVEYQPNLQTPVKAIPLGVIAEELSKNDRLLMIVGREPIGPVPGLQLEDAWGPFSEVVEQWVEAFSKSLRDCFGHAAPDGYAIDELAQRWKRNLYLREPQTQQSSLLLDEFARRRYRDFVYPKAPTPVRLKPWVRNQLQLQRTA